MVTRCDRFPKGTKMRYLSQPAGPGQFLPSRGRERLCFLMAFYVCHARKDLCSGFRLLICASSKFDMNYELDWIGIFRTSFDKFVYILISEIVCLVTWHCGNSWGHVWGLWWSRSSRPRLLRPVLEAPCGGFESRVVRPSCCFVVRFCKILWKASW